MRRAAFDRPRLPWRTRHASLPLRGAALMPAAALTVHQLRYRLAFGSHATHELAAQGHAYLTTLAPCIVLLAALGVGGSLGRLAQRWARSTAGSPPRRAAPRVWLLATLALVAIYVAQELLEGLLATGHPGGLVGVFGAGGWWSLPLALLVGGVLALALRGERALEAVAAAATRGGTRLPIRRLCVPTLTWPADAPALIAPAPLARAAAGRAPPPRPLATR